MGEMRDRSVRGANFSDQVTNGNVFWGIRSTMPSVIQTVTITQITGVRTSEKWNKQELEGGTLLCCILWSSTTFDAMYCWTTVKSGSHMHFTNVRLFNVSVKHVWSSCAPKKRPAIIQCSNTVMPSPLDFYLSHCHTYSTVPLPT